LGPGSKAWSAEIGRPRSSTSTSISVTCRGIIYDADRAPGGAFLTSSYTSHITDNILRVGLNYKLGSPVVAKHLAP
jgi:hypothetical protein